MRKTLLAFFAIICGTASAQEGWTFPEEVTIAPGGTATFNVNLDDAECETYISGSFNISFPEGFSVVSGSAKVNADRKVDHVFSADLNGEVYNCVMSSPNASYIKGTSGNLVSFDLKCDESVEEGEYTATVIRSNITYWDEEEEENGKVVKTNLTVKITVSASAAETVEIALGNASGYNTYVSDKDLDFTGLEAKAYIVSSVSATEATLTQVDAIKAGEGFIIEGAGEATIEVPVAAETPAASGTLLATGQPSEGDYLLAKDGSSFVLWDGTGTLAATKAYLPASAISSGAKIINIAFGESTGINEVQKS